MARSIWLLSPLLWLLACGAPVRTEDCQNGADDDQDNRTDCDDSDCQALLACASCGDGVLNGGEECDDGNTRDGDACEADCTFPFCGNGVTDSLEECDDGAKNSNTTPNTCRESCQRPRCGDGVQDDNEACDNGEQNSNSLANACRSNCQTPRCGDGARDNGEQCDDGNNQSGDACEANCTISFCGNNIIDLGEECDNGNQNSAFAPDACRRDCKAASCGDGAIDTGEECDDGNFFEGDFCGNDCTFPDCGNGVVDTLIGEVCDDGNNEDGDGCFNDCSRLEVCGNGFIDISGVNLILASEVVKIRFEYLVTSCGAPTPLAFSINNGLIFTSPPVNTDCDCLPGIEGFDVTDPGLLGSLSDGLNIFRVFVNEGTTRLAWVLVKVFSATDSLDVVLTDFGPQGDALSRNPNLCVPADNFSVGITSAAGFSNGFSTFVFEECDDGNTLDGDACTAACQIP